jgi:transposase
LAADIWTVTATAARHDIEPLSLLTGYLQACAHAGGTAPAGADLDPSCPGHPKDAPAAPPGSVWSRKGPNP